MASDIEETGGRDRTFSRRTLIKGGAIVGGTLWVAPVVESFTSKAWAASVTHYCCSCWNPVVSGVDPNQGAADAHPPTLADCVAFCNGTTAAQTDQYQAFAWTGPRPEALTYTANLTGLGGHGPGCYVDSTPETGCQTGTIQYTLGKPSGFTPGVFGTACTVT
jgi:hypothetical protein